MKHYSKILIAICLFTLLFAACSKSEPEKKLEKSLGFYQKYSQTTGLVSNKKDVLPAETQIYAQVINDKAFETSTVGMSVYTNSNGTKQNVGGSNVTVEPTSQRAIFAFTVNTPGDYTVEIYADKSENVIMTGNLKIGPKQ